MATQNQGGQNQQNTKQQDTKQQAQNAGARNTLGQAEQQTTYWRDQYQKEPYYTQGEKFEDYEPAYRTGAEGRQQYAGQKFDQVENNLRNDYQANQGSSTMTWENKGKQACHAAWDYADKNVSTDTDRQQSGRQSQR